MSAMPVQLRGHCQCCMRQQAVVGGRMAKHGYTIKDRGHYGWLQGICSGQHHAPIEHDHLVSTAIVNEMRDVARDRRRQADLMRRGEAHPATCKGRYSAKLRDYERIPWESAAPWQRTEAMEAEIYGLEHDAKARDQFADQLLELIARVHGQPLTEVKRDADPEPIAYGDRRMLPGGRPATAVNVHRGEVSWKDDRGFKGRCSTRSWRLWQKVEAAS